MQLLYGNALKVQYVIPENNKESDINLYAFSYL